MHMITVGSSEAISIIRSIPAASFLRLSLYLSAGLRQMLVPDTVLVQQLGQNQPVKLRPPRPRDTPHINEKFNIVFFQKSKKIRKRMPAMADGVDRWSRHLRSKRLLHLIWAAASLARGR